MTEKTPIVARKNVAKLTHLKAKPKRAKRKAAKLKLNGNGSAVAAVPSSSAPDPFNLASLSLPQDFNVSGVKRALNTLPVRKPKRQEFVRVHASIRGNVAVVEDETENEEYLVSDLNHTGFVNALSEALPGMVKSKTLYLTVTRQGVWFLWPVKLPGPDGKELDWTRSSREAAKMAIDTWLRVSANLQLGAYDIFTAAKITTKPVWPDVSDWSELLRIAFRSRLITSFDHPLIRNLTGE